MVARFTVFHLLVILIIMSIRSLLVIGDSVSFGNSRIPKQKQMAPPIASEKHKHRRHMRHTIKIATTTPATTATTAAGGDGAVSAIVLRKALLHPSAGPVGRRYSSECFFTPVNCHHFVRRTVFVPRTLGATSGGSGDNINLPRRRLVGTIESRRSSSSNNGMKTRSSSRWRRTRTKQQHFRHAALG
ncbi:hypothetical protein niasHT_033057 [Heterodera trifolii]|uniref:Secreted protein n=1 Tax=Heterodera trifolii TaxID=157864 RepID=A0ABD2IQZ7_9BILA